MLLTFLSASSAPSAVQKKSPYINVTNREDAKDTKEEKRREEEEFIIDYL
jgi:hypothetical protein